MGVTDTQLPERNDVSLSIMVRVMIMVTINLFKESKDEKIDLGEVGECNE